MWPSALEIAGTYGTERLCIPLPKNLVRVVDFPRASRSAKQGGDLRGCCREREGWRIWSYDTLWSETPLVRYPTYPLMKFTKPSFSLSLSLSLSISLSSSRSSFLSTALMVIPLLASHGICLRKYVTCLYASLTYTYKRCVALGCNALRRELLAARTSDIAWGTVGREDPREWERYRRIEREACKWAHCTGSTLPRVWSGHYTYQNWTELYSVMVLPLWVPAYWRASVPT